MLRQSLIVAGLLFAALFGFGLARVATNEGARRAAGEAAARKIGPTVEKAVHAAEVAAKLPGVRKLAHLPPVRKALEQLAEYRQDPAAFLAEHAPNSADVELPGPLKLVFPNWQKEMREHYAAEVGHIVRGVRVFLLTNLLAGLLCAAWAWRAPAADAERLAAIGGLLLLATGFALVLKFAGRVGIDVFVGTRVAWWYPLVVGIVFLSAWLTLSRDRRLGQRSRGAGLQRPAATTSAPASLSDCRAGSSRHSRKARRQLGQ